MAKLPSISVPTGNPDADVSDGEATDYDPRILLDETLGREFFRHVKIQFTLSNDAADNYVHHKNDEVLFAEMKEDFLKEIRGVLWSAYQIACSNEAERQAFTRDIQGILKELNPSDAEPAPAEVPTVDAAQLLPTEAPKLWLERSDRTLTPADFIKDVYGDWLGKGLTQAHVKHLDRSLYLALHKWLQSNGMPDDLDLPTKKQMNDRRISELWPTADAARPGTAALSSEDRERSRLYQAARRRSRQHG